MGGITTLLYGSRGNGLRRGQCDAKDPAATVATQDGPPVGDSGQHTPSRHQPLHINTSGRAAVDVARPGTLPCGSSGRLRRQLYSSGADTYPTTGRYARGPHRH